MEQDEEMSLSSMPSTSSEGSQVVVDKIVATAAGPPTATTTTVQGEVTMVYATAEQIRAVFNNRLIAENIMSNLNIADMNAARQVSRSFLEMVEGYKSFNNAHVLVVTKDKSPLSEINFLLNSDRIWGGIKIDVTLKSEDLKKIPRHILENVKLVSLVSEDLGKDDPTPIHAIVHILESTSKMSHLQMDFRLITKNLKDVFCSGIVRQNLKNLKHFDILRLDCEEFLDISDGDIVDFEYDNFLYDVYNGFAKNLLYLANEQILEQLESLSLPKVYFYASVSFTRAVVELLRRNLGTLRQLSLHLDVWETNDEMGSISIPHLKSLTVAVRKEGQDTLRDFLANHPSLEELDFTAYEEKIQRSLFEVIKERSANLKKLHLKAKRFDVLEGTLECVDWSFLERMSRLKDFLLVRADGQRGASRWDQFGSATRILACLPRNQVERLSFTGIGDGVRQPFGGFWAYWENYYENLGLRRGGVSLLYPVLPFKLDLLGGFRNLKRLSFNRCPDAVDDEIMLYILNEMTSLEEFQVSHCSRLTDGGIAGSAGDGSDSIRNLKGLKELSIRHCPLVTPEGLLSCLRLPFLRRLDYYFGERRVPRSFVLEIISQNPSLESLSVNMEYVRNQTEKDELEEVKRAVNNPRLTKFENLCDLNAKKKTPPPPIFDNTDSDSSD